MTKSELYDCMRERGFTEPEFFTELDEDTTGTVERISRMIEHGKSEEAWQEVENLHEEFIYFSVWGFDSLVVQEQ